MDRAQAKVRSWKGRRDRGKIMDRAGTEVRSWTEHMQR